MAITETVVTTALRNYKLPVATNALAFDVGTLRDTINALDLDIDFLINTLASPTAPGRIQLATADEIFGGTEATKAVTAATLRAQLATSAESIAGSIGNKWVSPAGVAQYITNLLATDADVIAGTSTTKLATPHAVKNLVDTRFAALLGTVPAALDTLNELAAALGNDANFATTVNNNIALKYDKSGGNITGNVGISGTLGAQGAVSFASTLTVTGQLNANGGLLLPGVGANIFSTGTGDGASYTLYNTVLKIWYGLALSNHDGAIMGFFDSRNARWDVKGGYRVNGQDVWHTGTFNPANYLARAGGEGAGQGMTGILLSMPQNQGGMANSAGSLGAIKVANDGNAANAAFMVFHRVNNYAAYLGLDTDNYWKVGGWSMGAVAYKIFHEGYRDASKMDVSGGIFTGAVDIGNGTTATSNFSLRTSASGNNNLWFRIGATARAVFFLEGANGNLSFNTYDAAGTVLRTWSWQQSGYLAAAGWKPVFGDIQTHRDNDTGAIFLGNSNTNYLFYDGANFIMKGTGASSTLFVSNPNGSWPVWHSGNFTPGNYAPLASPTFTSDIFVRNTLYLGVDAGGTSPQIQLSSAANSIAYIDFRHAPYGHSDFSWRLAHNTSENYFEIQYIDTGRQFLVNTNGQLWSRNYGWLHDFFPRKDVNIEQGFYGPIMINRAYPYLSLYHPGVIHQRLLADSDGSLLIYNGDNGTNYFRLFTSGQLNSTGGWHIQANGDMYLPWAGGMTSSALNWRIHELRLLYAGDLSNEWNSNNGFQNPYGGNAVVTDRWTGWNGANNISLGYRFRYIQHYSSSRGWVTVGTA